MSLGPQAILSRFTPGTNIAGAATYLQTEFSVTAFDGLERHLWMAGLAATHIRPLHRQKVVGRQLIIAEQIALHLVTFRGSIFVKPIPGYLLNNDFFKHHIIPGQYLHPLAVAFLSTYLKLVKYNSDLRIAQELGLVPPEISWETWLEFAEKVEAEIPNLQDVPYRYEYGELRLERLNLIAQFLHARFSRGFIMLDTNYTTYFSPIFKGVIFLFAYTTTYLAAFQVAMGAPDPPLQVVSVGFWSAVVVLFALASITIVLILWFVLLALDNLLFARRHRRYVQ